MNKKLINNNKLGMLNINGNSFECPLAHDLDESIQGAIGITGKVSFEKGQNYYDSINNHNNNNALYSNGDGASSVSGAGSYITPETIQAGTQLTTAIISGISNKNKGGSCKKPTLPESFINRGKWSTYKDCLAAEERQKQRDVEIAQAQAQSNASLLANQGNGNNRIEEGMSTSTKVLIAVGVTLFFGLAGFVTYKVIKSKN